MAEIERHLHILPTAEIAGSVLGRHGQVIVVRRVDEAVAEADRVASEHVQILRA